MRSGLQMLEKNNLVRTSKAHRCTERANKIHDFYNDMSQEKIQIELSGSFSQGPTSVSYSRQKSASFVSLNEDIICAFVRGI